MSIGGGTMQKSTIRLTAIAGACALALAAPVGARAASDVFLEIDGIPGESQAEGFQGAIEVESFSWEVTSNAGGGRGGGGGAGKARFSDFTIRKHFDQSSPALFLRAAN